VDGNVREVLTVIGEALVDLVDDGEGATFAAHLSGSPLNVAVGLARLERPTEFMARFSQDTFGRRLRGFAERNDVRLSAAVDAAQASTLAVVNLDELGKASYDFYIEGSADWQWTPDELRVPDGTRILHTGSLASWLPPGDEHIVTALRRARDTVLVSYDPNVRPSLLGTPERARPLIERAIPIAHLVKASEDDVAWLYPGDRLDDVARRWLDLGATAVILTRGEDGAVAYRGDADPITRPGRPVQLVDTIGAGDAFTSGLLSALAGAGVHDADMLAGADLGAALDEAILVAALTCERAGADPPTAAEVDAAR
jgi:fructokinase